MYIRFYSMNGISISSLDYHGMCRECKIIPHFVSYLPFNNVWNFVPIPNKRFLIVIEFDM